MLRGKEDFFVENSSFLQIFTPWVCMTRHSRPETFSLGNRYTPCTPPPLFMPVTVLGYLSHPFPFTLWLPNFLVGNAHIDYISHSLQLQPSIYYTKYIINIIQFFIVLWMTSSTCIFVLCIATRRSPSLKRLSEISRKTDTVESLVQPAFLWCKAPV